MLLHDARRAARVRGGEIVPLTEQDRTAWDAGQIAAAAPWSSARSRSADAGRTPSRRRSPPRPDADRLAGRRGALRPAGELTGSPVVALNRAVAVAEVDGPHAALEIVDGLRSTTTGTCTPRAQSCSAA